MKYKTDKETREATRKRVAEHRAKKAEVKFVTASKVPVTQDDYDKLPPSLKLGVEQGTKLRQALRIPLEIEERKAMAVRRFRGY